MWLIALGAKQDWEVGVLSIPDKAKGKMIVYNLKTRESHSQSLLENQSFDTNEEYDYDTDEESSTTSEDSSLEEDLLHVDPGLFGISIKEILSEESELEDSSGSSEDFKEVAVKDGDKDRLGEHPVHVEDDDAWDIESLQEEEPEVEMDPVWLLMWQSV